MSLYTLSKYDYQDLINKCKLDDIIVPLNILGAIVDDQYRPFSDKIFIDKIYNDYLQRDRWLENYIQRLASLDFVIWGEAARVGNKQYIYHVDKNNFFKYSNKLPGYFKNVKEVSFENSLVIDFLSPFGVNHTAVTRNEFYKLLFSNKYYRAFFKEYYESIINTLSFSLLIPENIIVAPGSTKKLILDFIRFELKITTDIKSYNISERGALESYIYF
jgi:hypothetical protein